MTIIHSPKRNQVRVIGAPHPVYKIYYGDGLGNVITGLFSKIVPKAIPMAKQLGMKALGFIGEKALAPVGDLFTGVASAAKDRILKLIGLGPKPKPKKIELPVTENMPPRVANAVNNMVTQKINELVQSNIMPDQRNIISSLIT